MPSIWGLVGNAKGRIKYDLKKPYRCETGETARGAGSMELALFSSDQPCDESQQVIPNGSKLNAAIHPIRRDDDFAVIDDKFSIRDPKGNELFTGAVVLINRINSHYKEPFGEGKCDQPDQMEGWFTGKGVEGSRAKGFELRAVFVARTRPINEGKDGYEIRTAHLAGALILCKH